MKRALPLLVALLALSACLTDPYGTQPEVKIDPEKLEELKESRGTDETDTETETDTENE